MQMHRKHLWIMLACCLIPLAGLAAIWILRIPANNVLFFGLILLCPLLHLIMMRRMMHGKGPTGAGHQADGHAHGDQPVPVTDKAGRSELAGAGENR